MALTLRDALNRANPNNLPAQLQRLWDQTNDIGLGDILGALRPRNRTRTGLTSAAAQVHDVAALIVSVENVQGTPLAIITGGTPGAGEVSIDYDATTGVPTIEFAAAVTAYSTTELGPVPQDLAAKLAATVDN